VSEESLGLDKNRQSDKNGKHKDHGHAPLSHSFVQEIEKRRGDSLHPARLRAGRKSVPHFPLSLYSSP
jgi:hypothetical protein